MAIHARMQRALPVEQLGGGSGRRLHFIKLHAGVVPLRTRTTTHLSAASSSFAGTHLLDGRSARSQSASLAPHRVSSQNLTFASHGRSTALRGRPCSRRTIMHTALPHHTTRGACWRRLSPSLGRLNHLLWGVQVELRWAEQRPICTPTTRPHVEAWPRHVIV